MRDESMCRNCRTDPCTCGWTCEKCQRNPCCCEPDEDDQETFTTGLWSDNYDQDEERVSTFEQAFTALRAPAGPPRLRGSLNSPPIPGSASDDRT